MRELLCDNSPSTLQANIVYFSNKAICDVQNVNEFLLLIIRKFVCKGDKCLTTQDCFSKIKIKTTKQG